MVQNLLYPYTTSQTEGGGEGEGELPSPFVVTDVTLDRIAVYGDQNYPEIRAKQSPVDLHTSFTYSFTPDGNLSPISGG